MRLPKVTTTRGEYRGRATISIKSAENEKDKYPFTFGLSKALKILAAYEEIKKFAEEQIAKRKGNTDEDDDG